MTNKPFFKRRTNTKIKELETKQIRSQHNLVERIYDMDGNSQAILLYTQLIPGQYHKNTVHQSQASRKCFKHGEYVHIGHPQTKQECYNSPTTPLVLRKEALGKLEEISEDEIFSQGISFRPNWSDRTKRLIPYVFAAEALRLFAYSENSSEPIKAKVYKDSRRVKQEGASALVQVPSRRRDIQNYLFRLEHIPAVRSQDNLATVLTLRPSQIQDGDGRNISQRVAHDVTNIRYTRAEDQEASKVITFYPHDIAAYIAVIKECNKDHNLTPLEMNPFPLFSRALIENFYTKLENNMLVFDPTISRKDHLRRPHLAEKNILLARAIKTLGHDKTAFWDPIRDGKLKDYNWNT